MSPLKVLLLSDNAFGIRQSQFVSEVYFPTLFFELFNPAIRELTIVGKPIKNDQDEKLYPIKTDIQVRLLLYPPNWGRNGAGILIATLRFAWLLAKELKRSDIVLAKWFSFRSLIGVLVGRILRFRGLLVVQIVGDPVEAFRGRYRRLNRYLVSVGSWLLSSLTKWMVAQCDVLYAVSEQLRAKYGREGKASVVASESRLKEEYFHYRVRDRIGEVPLLLFVGRLEEVKGVDYLLKALAILQSRGFKCRLRIVGSGTQMDRYRELAHRLGIAHSVEWIGFVPFDALLQHYRQADLFVLPSLSEGMPLVILEAMANSLPVVATQVGGIPELVQHGRNGVLVPPANAMALADAIRSVLEDRQRYRQMTKLAYEAVLGRTEMEERLRAARIICTVFRAKHYERVERRV